MRRVVVVEDDGETRERVAAVLRQSELGLDVVGEFDSGASAVAFIETCVGLDLALVDLGLPGIHGVEVVRRLSSLRPEAISLVLTVFDDPETVLASVRAGARGYLLKQLGDVELIAAVRVAIDGGAPMTPRIARVVLDSLRGHGSPAARAPELPLEPLTPRERDVLRLLATGSTYADVGSTLGIGLGTVQGYVKIIYGKLQVRSKTEAAQLASSLGLIA